ncbi:MAG TPA: peptide chain release factor 2 [Candidatus Nanoarchaeia archaeon]|nr:peptide chain release factor 2 [uncultured archaeon]
MKELKDRLELLQKRLSEVEKKTDRENLQKELRQLEAQGMKGDFWTDVKTAQVTMQKISDLKEELSQFENLEERIKTVHELLSLSGEETKDLNLAAELDKIERELNEVEDRLFLGGKYDSGNCFLSVHAGQGGVEAMDWAAMLLRMYQRFCERKGWSVTLVDETKGEEAGIKSSTVEITGRLSYGLLKRESGTHRLVRQSPYNADHLRQTSFALVEVLPVVEDASEVTLNEADLQFDIFKSSGPGGQNVQKVSTAVRVKHLPSGITVTCQTERSQHQNKENALKILRGKLFQLEELKREEAERKLKSWQKTASWGTQIRSYVLHPYKLVKDLRTNYETSNTDAVLNGEIDEFIEAEIRL